MSKINTAAVPPPRYWHLPIAQARTADRFAADALIEAIERKKRTEAKLVELGVESYKPMETLVR
jgi:hypothetical protein